MANTTAIQLEKCQLHKDVWIESLKNKSNFDPKQSILTFTSVEEAMEVVLKIKNPDVLVTGSLHLVGSALNYYMTKLNPDYELF